MPSRSKSKHSYDRDPNRVQNTVILAALGIVFGIGVALIVMSFP